MTTTAADLLFSAPDRYAAYAAREALAMALHHQTQISHIASTPYMRASGGGGSPCPTLWTQLAPEKREEYRQMADRSVAEQAGDSTALTKHQKRNLEAWEREILALAEGHDPDGYFDAKDDRAGKTIAQHFKQEVAYDHKLDDSDLLQAWETADKLGLHLPAFPTDYFDPIVVEKVARRQLTEWEASIMAFKVGASVSSWPDYRFGVPFEFRFTPEDVQAHERHLITPGAMVISTPAMTDADQTRYQGAWGKV